MALTPEQEQQRLELIQEQNKAAKELASTYEKIAKNVRDLSNEEKEVLDISKQISKYSTTIEKSIQTRANKSASLLDLTSSLNKLQNDYSKNLATSQKAQDNLNREIQYSINIRQNITASLQQEIQDQAGLSNTLNQQEQAYQHLLTAKASGQRVTKAQLDLAKLNVDNAKKELDVNKKLVEELREKQKEQNTHIKQLEDTKKAHQEILEQQKQEIQATKIAIANNALQSIANKLQIGQLLTLGGLYTFILNSTFKIDKQLTDLGKSIGISKESARELRNEFTQYVALSKDGFINTERLVKAQLELTQQLGFGAKFSEQELETFSRLTEIVGLAGNEAAKFNEFSAAVGMSSTDYVKNIRSAAFSAQQTNKIHISDKELLSTIGKLSAGILVKFQNNPKAIAEAVIQAKKLGLSLEQVDKIGESMLNWESSIQNELEAELITGKQLNFERARAAALTGNQIDLMQEIASQVGSLADFQNMNVIAQESLAKAFGINRSEMAEMLIKQEAINKYGDKAAELNAEQLKDMQSRNMTVDQYLKMQQEQRSVQEKFNDAMLKLQDIIGNLVAGPLGKVLNMFASILEYTDLLAAAASLYITRLLTINTLKLIELRRSKKIAATDAAGAAAGAAKSATGIPVIGWILAAGVATTLFALLSGMFDKADDMVATGYGKRMLLEKGSITAFNDDDAIVAGTNLGGSKKSESNAGVMAAINNLANIMSKPAPTPQFALSVDGERLGSVIGRQQETGTQQTKNAYRLA